MAEQVASNLSSFSHSSESHKIGTCYPQRTLQSHRGPSNTGFAVPHYSSTHTRIDTSHLTQGQENSGEHSRLEREKGIWLQGERECKQSCPQAWDCMNRIGCHSDSNKNGLRETV